jgi:hypothetical protein
MSVDGVGCYYVVAMCVYRMGKTVGGGLIFIGHVLGVSEISISTTVSTKEKKNSTTICRPTEAIVSLRTPSHRMTAQMFLF